jgi:hypothetical protein
LEPGLEPCKKKAGIGDGAEWIWNPANQRFHGAIQIVDLCHARQHLWELARKLHPVAQELKAHYDEVKQKRRERFSTKARNAAH